MNPDEVEKLIQRMNGPLLILLIGLPGSGKSTWTRQNASGAIVVSQDDLIDAITPLGFEYSARPIYAAAEEVIARAALQAGRTVIVDRTNRTAALRARWIAIGREAQCKIVAIVMSTDVETCRIRNRARSGQRRVSEERMDRMIAVFQHPTLDEGFYAIREVTGEKACVHEGTQAIRVLTESAE
jgi:predicted kinase